MIHACCSSSFFFLLLLLPLPLNAADASFPYFLGSWVFGAVHNCGADSLTPTFSIHLLAHQLQLTQLPPTRQLSHSVFGIFGFVNFLCPRTLFVVVCLLFVSNPHCVRGAPPFCFGLLSGRCLYPSLFRHGVSSDLFFFLLDAKNRNVANVGVADGILFSNLLFALVFPCNWGDFS
eukprot:RCo029593